MGGCTNCAGKSGCDDRKGSMFETLNAVLARLYPTRTWGEPDDLARFQAGVCEHDAEAIATELAAELDASTFYRPGEPDEYCDYIYVLCLGREPCLVQLRDGQVALPDELRDALAVAAPGTAVIQEQYLRVCVSHMARVAGVQQTAVDLIADPDGAIVRESPRPGVYDAPLLRRFQRLVAILPAYDVTHLDFGEISGPPAGFASGDYGRLYGGEPHTANYLFYPQPSNMQIAAYLDAP